MVDLTLWIAVERGEFTVKAMVFVRFVYQKMSYLSSEAAAEVKFLRITSGSYPVMGYGPIHLKHV